MTNKVNSPGAYFGIRTDGSDVAIFLGLLILLSVMFVSGPARPAPENTNVPFVNLGLPQSDQPLLVEADRLIYDFDRKTVTAVGSVELNFQDYIVRAHKVTYFQAQRRLIASGSVQIIDPAGNIVTAKHADITEDFADGFIKNLHILTTKRARFAAQSAERRDGELTILNRGVYTACEPCEDHPERPPFWQIKATTIIHNNQKQTITYENARFEFLGVPIAYWPKFTHPDSQRKRKTGFLIPDIKSSGSLGFGIQTPFFWNLAPNYDITFAPTIYSKQGLLLQGEWRQRLMKGAYKIQAAGIHQQKKSEFVSSGGTPLSGFRDERWSVFSTGRFAINNYWSWGWSVVQSSDRTFNRDYSINGVNGLDIANYINLTGRSDKNYFDLRALYFRVQRENTVELDIGAGGPPPIYRHDDQPEQAFAHPVADHNYIWASPVVGGQLRFDSNITSLSREDTDIRTTPMTNYFAGVAGSSFRASANATWEKTIIAAGGHVITPFAYVKTSLNWADFDGPTLGLVSGEWTGRVMPAVGFEYEWPIMAITQSGTHTIKPVVQVIARPSEQDVGTLPNEDAQSLVFDDTILFERDKFSGFDRQEGGTRANLGFTYQARFTNGMSIDGIIGQSYNLAGANSFALSDPTRAGSESGLESDTSDLVGRITMESGYGQAISVLGRLDDETGDLRRAELNARTIYRRSNASLGYVYLGARPSVGIYENRQEFNGYGNLALSDNWSVAGSFVYDIRNQGLVKSGLGLGYENECFAVSANFTETRDRYTDLVDDRRLFVRVFLRTLGSHIQGQDSN